MPYIGNVTTSSNVNGSQINNGTITGDKLSLPFDYDSATLYLDNTNNRVGILTASPSSTLTVGTGGVVSIPLASAATPSLVFGTDTNTGIYSPGADQVAISTNGTGRLFVDASGLVGIGNSIPSGILHASASSPDIFIQDTQTHTTTDGPLIQFQGRGPNATNYNFGYIQGLSTASNNAGVLRFATNSAGVQSVAMTIDSSQRVGIGITSPAAKLHVVTSGAGDIRHADGTRAVSMGSTGTVSYIGCITPGQDFALYAGNGEKARIDNSGRLLVGTTSGTTQVAAKFQARAGTPAAQGTIMLSRGAANPTNAQAIGEILFTDSNESQGAKISAVPEANWATNDYPTRLVFSTTADGAASPTERLRIDSSGRVGVGTTNPGSVLHARLPNTSTATIATFDRSDGAVSSEIHYDGSDGRITFGTTTNHPLSFETNNTRAVTIDTSQRVGIGTSSPSQTLSVVAPSNAQAIGIWNRTSDHTYGAIIFKTSDGATDQSIIQNAKIGTNGAQLSFYTKPDGGSVAEKLTIDSTGRVGIGTTTPGAPLSFADTNALKIQFNGNVANFYGISKLAGGGNLGDGEFRFTAGNVTGGAFTFKSGSSERARIDSSGRLLVGTSSALATYASQVGQVQFAQTNTVPITSVFRFTNDTGGPNFYFNKSRSSSLGANTIVQNADALGALYFAGANGSSYSIGASISAAVDGTPGANDMPGRLVFSTTADGASSPTERMRIDSAGSVNIFGTENQLVLNRSGHSNWNFGNSSAGLTLSQDLQDGNGLKLRLHISKEVSPAFGIQFYNTSEVETLRVGENGNVQNTNNSYGSLSDIKLKENIVDASSQWDDLKSLQVRKYNFKEETGHETHTQIGLVAQEVELVSPGLVSESPDLDEEGTDLGTVTKSVNYSVLYMKAVKALQEAMERIETLEAKVAALEAN